MKKFDNFMKVLDVLKSADFTLAATDDIYRAGVIAQYNLTFELCWKCLQEVLRLNGVLDAVTGSPRDILKLAFKTGLIDNEDIWLKMLLARNIITHIYSSENAMNIIDQIKNTYIPTFDILKDIISLKIAELSNS